MYNRIKYKLYFFDEHEMLERIHLWENDELGVFEKCFQLMGIEKDIVTNKIGTFYFDILNNSEIIIQYINQFIADTMNNKDELRKNIFNLAENLETISFPLRELVCRCINEYLDNQSLKKEQLLKNKKQIEESISLHKKAIKSDRNIEKFYENMLKSGSFSEQEIQEIQEETIEEKRQFIEEGIQESEEEYKDVKKEIRKISTRNNIIYIVKRLKKIIQQILKHIEFINVYYDNEDLEDYFVNSNILDGKNKRSKVFILQSAYDLNISLPMCNKYFCVITEEEIIPASAWIDNKIINNREGIKNKNFKRFFEEQINKDQNIEDIRLCTTYEIGNFENILSVYLNYFIENNLTIRKCKNCGKYFIPINKSNETLCNNIYRNRKDM